MRVRVVRAEEMCGPFGIVVNPFRIGCTSILCVCVSARATLSPRTMHPVDVYTMDGVVASAGTAARGFWELVAVVVATALVRPLRAVGVLLSGRLPYPPRTSLRHRVRSHEGRGWNTHPHGERHAPVQGPVQWIASDVEEAGQVVRDLLTMHSDTTGHINRLEQEMHMSDARGRTSARQRQEFQAHMAPDAVLAEGSGDTSLRDPQTSGPPWAPVSTPWR